MFARLCCVALLALSSCAQSEIKSTPNAAYIGANQVQRTSDKWQVVPGASLGSIAIGDSFDDVVAANPLRKNFDSVHDASEFQTPSGRIQCAKVYHRNSLSADEPEIFVYFENDRVIQIEGGSPSYNGPFGIKLNDVISEVIKKVPNAKVQRLMGSGSKAVGGKDLIYLSKKTEGFAFEFRNSDGTSPKVSRFIVFRRNSDFLPGTCVTPPQTLQVSDKF